MKLSTQQQYYAELVKRIKPPFDAYAWKFAGFNPWYVKTRRKYVCEFYYEFGEGPLVADAQESFDEDMKVSSGIVPDAFHVDEEAQHLTLLEIVDTHDIDEQKARRINSIAWFLDEAYWSTDVLLFYPRHGSTVINQGALYLDGLAKQFAKRKTPYRDAFTSCIASL